MLLVRRARRMLGGQPGAAWAAAARVAPRAATRPNPNARSGATNRNGEAAVTSASSKPEESTDVYLVAVTFGSPTEGHDLADEIAHAEAGPHAAAVVVERTVDGAVQLTQTAEVDDEQSGWAGPWWGLLVATAYAASIAGTLWGISLGPLWNRLRELGLSAEWMDGVAQALPEGGSAAFFLIGPNQREVILAHVDAETIIGLHEVTVPPAVQVEIRAKLARAKPV